MRVELLERHARAAHAAQHAGAQANVHIAAAAAAGGACKLCELLLLPVVQAARLRGHRRARGGAGGRLRAGAARRDVALGLGARLQEDAAKGALHKGVHRWQPRCV